MNACLVSWRLLSGSADWRVTSATRSSRRSTAAMVTRRCNQWLCSNAAEDGARETRIGANSNGARFSMVLRRAVQERWSCRCANIGAAQPLLPSSVIYSV
jgi:hypothetical protein